MLNSGPMRLEPLYRMVFDYDEGWTVQPGGGDLGGDYLLMASGRCEGTINGTLRGANHPHRRADGTFCPDFHGVITTGDEATLLFHLVGYGRTYPEDARQIVCSVTHVAEDDRFSRLNDTVCVGTGEVLPDGLYIDVAELIWEPSNRPRF